MAARKHLTLKRKIELIDRVERGGKTRKEFAEDFGVSAPGYVQYFLKCGKVLLDIFN